MIGHDSTIPPMLKMFGYADPINIAPNEYDNLFVLIANDIAGRPSSGCGIEKN